MSITTKHRFNLRILWLFIAVFIWISIWRGLSLPLPLGGRISAADTISPDDWLVRLASSMESSETAIPNIVHYVWILKPDSNLSFQFKHFVSVYSAGLYLKADTVFIHTNADPGVVSRAKDSGSYWTKKMLQLPFLTVRQMEFPTHTNRGVKLDALEHISDFARPSILKEYGGVYLDFDAIPIRDFKALRESGFNNVFGHELNEKVNNGVMLSKKGSQLMDIFDQEQHAVFDGDWITHSVNLLTSLAQALARVEGEVLILERKAFNPDGVNYVRAFLCF
ncbi:hypothetical protein ONS96_012911 [Cadophora gregata f. sp. sojae]|nr:hypothetical protein ONS96_012911 [Cadophora gregata f. sp. sojae]